MASEPASDPAGQLLTGLRQTADGAVAVVAFSGGTDSALVVAAAARALGPDRVLAVTAVSPSLSDSELASARRFAADLGVPHLTPASFELRRPGYVANTPTRCFHCKTEVMAVVAHAATAALPPATAFVIMTGTNADDVRDPHRPGIAAAAQAGAATPLSGLTKQQVRDISRAWGLPTHDKPAQACLASRLAYGVVVSADALGRVQRAERSLREYFTTQAWRIADLRVRDLGDDAARIEVDAEAVTAVAADPTCLNLVREAGFARAHVDPQGFRSGSMNDLLARGAAGPATNREIQPARR